MFNSLKKLFARSPKTVTFPAVALHGSVVHPCGILWFRHLTAEQMQREMLAYVVFQNNGKPSSVMLTTMGVYEDAGMPEEKTACSSIANVSIEDNGYVKFVTKDGWQFEMLPSSENDVYNMAMIQLLWSSKAADILAPMIQWKH